MTGAGTGSRPPSWQRASWRRWPAELALGARLVVAGGREGWLRAGLTAVGVGLGVALLLLATAVPTMLAQREAREQQRSPAGAGPEAGPDTLAYQQRSFEFRDRRVQCMLVQPDGPAAPVPPGLAELPGPGELVVSPALASLLDSADGELLRPRLDYPVAGTIGDDGLRGPRELLFYLGAGDLTEHEPVARADRFGAGVPGPERLTPLLLLLLVIGVVALLLPVLTFVAVAARFGGEQRDRRLAALRLVGADAAATRRIAAGETLVAALLGLLVGTAGFLAGRQMVERFAVGDLNAFAADVRPVPGLAGLVLLAVPVLSVVVTLLAMRRVVAEPLGVVRQRPGRTRRRLWWRLVLPATGAALLVPLQGTAGAVRGELDLYQTAAGAVLVLLGVAAMLPWLVDALVRRLRGGGGVSWQLAVRRLQVSGGSTGRVVNGVAVAAAGAVALQLVFAAALDASVADGPEHPDLAVVTLVEEAAVARAEAVTARFAGTAGVRSAAGLRLAISRAGDGPGPTVGIADCATLATLADVDRCADGDVFRVSAPSPAGRDLESAPGTVLEFPQADGSAPSWTVPATAEPVGGGVDPFGYPLDVLATPGAGVPGPGDQLKVYLELDPADPDAIEHARNTAGGIDPFLPVRQWRPAVNENFRMLQRGLLAGVVVTLLLVGFSLLVGTVEQLRERRRQLAVLVAFGTRRRTLAWSVLWQAALPMVLGLSLAAVAGVGLGALLLAIDGTPLVVDLPGLAMIVGVAAAALLVVTVLTLPVLWRFMRPDGLRTE